MNKNPAVATPTTPAAATALSNLNIRKGTSFVAKQDTKSINSKSINSNTNSNSNTSTNKSTSSIDQSILADMIEPGAGITITTWEDVAGQKAAKNALYGMYPNPNLYICYIYIYIYIYYMYISFMVSRCNRE